MPNSIVCVQLITNCFNELFFFTTFPIMHASVYLLRITSVDEIIVLKTRKRKTETLGWRKDLARDPRIFEC